LQNDIFFAIFKQAKQHYVTTLIMLALQIQDLAALPTVAKDIINFAGDTKIWLLNGEMGAGKTTLSKAICAELGVIDTVSSPTFSIVNQYLTQKGETIYHFDFYRLKNEQEAFQIGVEEYFYSGNLCLIEWASKIPSFLPATYVEINIFKNELEMNEQRRIVVKKC
jgi:tRNA threonylcarbamoyladenosine biosynthesis protein TsaE